MEEIIEKMRNDIKILEQRIDDCKDNIKSKRTTIDNKHRYLKHVEEETKANDDYCNKEINKYEYLIEETIELIKKYEIAIAKLEN